MAKVDGPSSFQRFMVWLMPRMTPVHVWAYRKLGGKYANRTTSGGPALVLTTVGRRTGQPRRVALGYYENSSAWIIVGSNGGLPAEPSWALNLRADPSVDIQVGADHYAITGELLAGDEREGAWQAYIAAYPDYEKAQTWTGRVFPVFRLPKPAAE